MLDLLSIAEFEYLDIGLSKPKEGLELDGKKEDTATDINREEGRDYYEEEDGPWYLGKAKEEFHKRQNGQAAQRMGDEEDPIQVRSTL